MRAIVMMFDSLRRDFLPGYGGDAAALPNFARLAQRAVRFDNFWAGSLPCMPARRELHTGRYNFLHRGWGPLEPFDVSMPELLKGAGVHTHIVSDHYHYWMDGGANYHSRYSTWENVRGQEGDFWQADLNARPATTTLAEYHGHEPAPLLRQDAVNRRYMQTPAQTPQARVFDAGLEFIHRNHSADNWFLQLECFDPHEPFFTRGEWERLFPDGYGGRPVDWPQTAPVDEPPELVAHIRNRYRALLAYCDANLGRLLDTMDRYGMWQDTMLILNTDHGYLLGEKGWWGKNLMPYYNEIAHTPFFLHDPRRPRFAESSGLLAQTIDIPPTLLDFFGVDIPPEVQGKPLPAAAQDGTPIREYALFGIHGGHVNITDGRHVYMRAPVRASNEPLYEYTLMPARSFARLSPGLLADAGLAPPQPFTRGCPTLRFAANTDLNPGINMHRFGHLLFDLQADPHQEAPTRDEATERRLCEALRREMAANAAPPEQYTRLGL